MARSQRRRARKANKPRKRLIQKHGDVRLYRYGYGKGYILTLVGKLAMMVAEAAQKEGMSARLWVERNLMNAVKYELRRTDAGARGSKRQDPKART